MRDVKFIVGLLLLAASVLVTLACYLKSHGAGISVGVLLTIVILSFLYDNSGHIFGSKPSEKRDARSQAMKLAMRQGRNDAVRGDADAH